MLFELDEASGIVLALKYTVKIQYKNIYMFVLAVLGFTDSFKDSDPLSVSGLHYNI